VIPDETAKRPEQNKHKKAIITTNLSGADPPEELNRIWLRLFEREANGPT
jgi:hypothetical protein